MLLRRAADLRFIVEPGEFRAALRRDLSIKAKTRYTASSCSRGRNVSAKTRQ